LVQGFGPSAELDKFAIEPVVINENIGQQYAYPESWILITADGFYLV
jgi:hypothetical protein